MEFFCWECGKRLMLFPQCQNNLAKVFGCVNCNVILVGRSDESNGEIRAVVSLKKVTCRQLLMDFWNFADSNLRKDLTQILAVCGKWSVDEKMICFATKIVNPRLISSAARGNKPKLPYELEQTLGMWVPSIPVYNF